MRLVNWIYTLPMKLRALLRRRQLERETRRRVTVSRGAQNRRKRREWPKSARGSPPSPPRSWWNPTNERSLPRSSYLGVPRYAIARFALCCSFAADKAWLRNHHYTHASAGHRSTTAVFSVVDRVLFRSLPYPHDDRLVSFGVKAPFEGLEFMLAPEYLVLRNQLGPFQSMTSLTPGGADCDITEQNPVRLSCALVESNFLSTFGISPIIGRDFSRDDDRPNSPQVALLSYGLWQSRFAGDPQISGKFASVNGKSVQIIGVLPANFEMPTLNRADMLMPQAIDEAAQDRNHPQLVLRAFARLKPSVTITQATAALQPWFQDSLRFVPPQFREEVSLQVRSLRDRQFHDSRVGAWVLFGAVLAVLLLACSNVANLTAGARHSSAARTRCPHVLGATRARLAKQALTESLLLAILGGIAGCGLAWG